MTEKNGATFLMAVGFFLIAISPMVGNKYLHIVTGLALTGLGYYLTKHKRP
ncbi:TPA: hypothetical protein ACQN7J_001342 [Streptococcus pyogenes]|uniref:Uncharacterized protein n=2 Tax=Streptococcus TaxID=1301 RepID=A0A9X8T294_STREQ|nr:MULTISPECIES: hypothetical protein [Streptococcus]EGR88794.1 hypothetical protein HMPREF9963_1623 [Streptococcus dysgalactiae subsp. equisimilis SK1250]EPZ42806.1 hypothetical protein HMPREF1228_1506 [Streptococcus pyogenes GA41345]EQL79435.1 hypothetical protein HMPREF1225_1523 [Streptococcus pyogenes UTSW-2]EQL82850.1 hypothetical protein HMPREF1230_1019 [Streptococcus pyogenes GA19681]ERL17679.1 hypothetical protein HMPREF1227_1475 [Streptococcus pyogenes GA41046]ESA46250.1 hypothetical